MIVASLLIAGGVLLASAMASADVSTIAGATLLAASGMAGAWFLRDQARVRGLPLLCAAVVGVSLLVATAIGGGGSSIVIAGGGVVFMAVLAGTTSPSRAGGLAATGILAGALILSALI